MLNLSKENIKTFNECGPLFARILGFSKKGKILLRAIKRNSSVPSINKMSNYLRQTLIERDTNIRSRLLKMINYDILATDIYVLGNKKAEDRIARLDFTHKLEIKKD